MNEIMQTPFRHTPFPVKLINLVIAISKARTRKNPFGIGKYLLRIYATPRVANVWLEALASRPILRQALEHSPLLFLKPFKPYLNAGYDVHQRIAALLAHYSFIDTLPDHIVAPLLKGERILLCAIEGKDDSRFTLTLSRADKFDREGELLLELRNITDATDHRVACTVFSVVKETEPLIKISCVQSGTKDAVRHATRQLDGVRPKNLLVDATYYLAEAWGMTRIEGISNARQIKGSLVFADYDAFWEELGGTYLTSSGEFLLPKQLEHKRPEQVPSAKRSEYRRRLNLRQNIRQQILARF